jgi:hypothetical protein
MLRVLLAAPTLASADAPVPCTGSHGNVLVCGKEPIYGLTVSSVDDGTSRSWRRTETSRLLSGMECRP